MATAAGDVIYRQGFVSLRNISETPIEYSTTCLVLCNCLDKKI